MSLLQIAVRAVVAYVYLLLSVRTSGKRVVAQATPFDFVIALVIGDLVDDALWGEVSSSRFFVAVGTLVLFDCLLKFLTTRSDQLYLILQSRPSIVMRDGAEDGQALRHEQLTEAELSALLRMQGVEERRGVRLAALERDHGLSVLKQEWARPVTAQDLGLVEEKRG